MQGNISRDHSAEALYRHGEAKTEADAEAEAFATD